MFRGAKITGISTPNKPVTVTLYLNSNAGREFKYENGAKADIKHDI